ncbi:MAG: helix-turn-helix domain-containing protein [Gemmataceae bacterium]
MDIPAARRLREAGQSYQAIADKFGVSAPAVWHWINDRGLKDDD